MTPAAKRTAAPLPTSTVLPGGLQVLRRKCGCGGRGKSADEECESCRKGDDTIRRRATGREPPAGVPHIVSDVLGSSGRPLDPQTRAFFEPRFGQDFSQVRVHTDAHAAESARSVGARAYTVGRQVVFGAGEYAPGTSSGRSLLAHELAHTVQQRSAPAAAPQTKLQVGRADDPAEAAADRAAEAVMGGGTAQGLLSSGPVLRRACRRTSGTNNPATVTCDDRTEWDVETIVRRGRVPSTEASVTGGLNARDIFLRVRVCRGRDEVQILTSVNVPRALQDIVENALRGSRTPLAGVELAPEVRITWARSRDFELEVFGGPVTDLGTGQTRGRVGVGAQSGRVRGRLEAEIDPNVRGPGGLPGITGRAVGEVVLDPVRGVDCFREDRTIDFVCRPVTRTPGRDPIPEDEVQAYVFFEYATANVVPPTPRLLRGNADLTGSLASLAEQGYRAIAVDAFTSPEGPRPRRRPQGFVGNDQLSVDRRDAALTWLQSTCAACVDAIPGGAARSELYSATTPGGREVEGDPLTARAREQFLGSETEPADPLRRPDHDRLRTRTPQQQRDELYPMLRRAVIRLRRGAQPGSAPQRTPGAQGACRADVREAMQR